MKNERQEQIMHILLEKNNVSVRYLHSNVFASLSTLRRDLIEMERSGRIRRYHGRISLVSSNIEPAFSFRKNACADEKMYICNLAKRFLRDNISIFIDSSSTTFNLCNHLGNYLNLVAITNGIETASSLSRLKKVNSYMTGGKISSYADAVTGNYANEFLKQFRVDIAFISCMGICIDGANDADTEQATIKKTMIDNAKKTLLLVDSSKFGNENFYRLTDFANIDCIITEKKPTEEYIVVFKNNNCDIVWE